MWDIVNVSGTNFGSLAKFSYSFEQLLYLVRGNNLDVNSEGDHVSNGSGKTSFIDSIPVCLFGISLANRKLYSCVRHGYPCFSLSVTLSKGEDKLYVQRIVSADKTPTQLIIKINGKKPEGVVSRTNSVDALDVAQGQQYIYDVLGLNKEQVLSYFCIGSNNYTPFPLLTEKERIDTINLVSGAVHIDKVIDVYRDEYKDIESKKEKEEVLLSTLHILVTELEEKLSEDKKEFVEIQKTRIQDLKKDITSKQVRIREIRNKEAVIDSSEKDNTLRKKKYEEELKDLKYKESSYDKYEGEIRTLRRALEGSVSCPKCKESFDPFTKRHINDIKDEIRSKEYEMKKYNRDEVRSSIKKASASLSEIDKEILKSASAKGENKQEVLHLTTAIQEIKEEIGEERLKDKTFEKEEKRIKEKKAKVVLTKKDITKLKVSSELVSRRGRLIELFKRYLCNTTLSHVEVLANRSLKNMHVPFSVKIESYKLLRNSEKRPSINPVIYRGGVERIEYSYLSRGEQGMINMSFDLALRDVVNAYSGSGLNFYCNDEKLNAIDEAGISSITESYEGKKAGLMLLCTHSAPTTKVKKEINVIKKDGVSEVECR